MMATLRQSRGATGEAVAADYLAGVGWSVLGRNLIVRSGSGPRMGRDEIDLLCLDPGPPRTLVVVEVRSARSSAFGAPEERVDGPKVGRLYRALAALSVSGIVPPELVGQPRRVDLLLVDRRSGRVAIRHLRGIAPP